MDRARPESSHQSSNMRETPELRAEAADWEEALWLVARMRRRRAGGSVLQETLPRVTVRERTPA